MFFIDKFNNTIGIRMVLFRYKRNSHCKTGGKEKVSLKAVMNGVIVEMKR